MSATAVQPALVAARRVVQRLVIPVDDRDVQHLLVVTRTEAGTADEDVGLCGFVPLVEDVPGAGSDGSDARSS